jgi:hypothetical protein
MLTVQPTICCALLCKAILQPTILCALVCVPILHSTIRYTDYPLYNPLSYVLYSACRYCTRLSAIPTIRSALPVDNAIGYSLYRQSALLCSALYHDSTTDYPLYRQSALLCITTVQPTIRSTDNPLCSVSRHFNLLSASPTIHSALYHDISTDYPLCSALYGYSTTDYPLCSVSRQYNQLSVVPTIRSALHCDTTTDYPLCSVWQQYNRLSALATIRSALHWDSTTNHPLYRLSALLYIQYGNSTTDYPLCSALRQYNQLSALLYMTTV